MNAKGRPDGFYEVDLKLTARATRGDATVFQVELLYGGLFELGGFSEEQLELILLIECPRFLFPFARRIVSDMTAEGGFPPPAPGADRLRRRLRRPARPGPGRPGARRSGGHVAAHRQCLRTARAGRVFAS